MRNLLKETIDNMALNGKTVEDIIYIGSSETNHACTWAEFSVLANVEYHDGFGAQEVARDLIIAFSDGTRMQRGEYDGSEWWDYVPLFKAPAETQPIRKIVGGMWATLDAINEGETV